MTGIEKELDRLHSTLRAIAGKDLFAAKWARDKIDHLIDILTKPPLRISTEASDVFRKQEQAAVEALSDSPEGGKGA